MADSKHKKDIYKDDKFKDKQKSKYLTNTNNFNKNIKQVRNKRGG